MGDKIATRASYGKILPVLGEENKNIVVLDADLSGSTKSGEFAKKFPERFFNCGIAECNMMGIAAGLAAAGKTVFASSFAMFAAGRAFEVVRNSIAHTGLNVKICASHAGLTVGEDGASHQCLEDLAIMRVLPNMTVVCPADDTSARKLIRQVSDMNGPCYVRLGRAEVPVIYSEDQKIELGKALTIREGSYAAIIACGVMVDKAMKAAEVLADEGINVRVIDMHTIKPIDKDVIIAAAKETKGIVVCEEHNVIGGLGSAVSEVAVQHAPCKMEFIGVKDCFGESGLPDELLAKYNMDVKDIVAAVKKL